MMRKAKALPRPAAVCRLLALALACIVCARIAWVAAPRRNSSADVVALRPCSAENIPILCSHRIVGDEADVLSSQPVRAMTKLFKQGIYCFDADVVR